MRKILYHIPRLQKARSDQEATDSKKNSDREKSKMDISAAVLKQPIKLYVTVLNGGAMVQHNNRRRHEANLIEARPLVRRCRESLLK